MLDLRRSLVALVLAAVATTAMAQDRPGRGEGERLNRPGEQQDGQPAPARREQSEQNGPGILALLPPDAVTEHSIDVKSGKLAYTATAGTFPLFDQSGSRSAQIFYTAYVAKTDNPSTRPVTFVFNGGPGAASAFLNLGLVGPRIAEFGANGRDGSHVRLVDN